MNSSYLSSPGAHCPPHPFAAPPSPWTRVKCMGFYGNCADVAGDHLSGEALAFAQACSERSEAFIFSRFYNEHTDAALVIVVELAKDNSINTAAFAQTGLDASHRVAMPSEFEPLLAQFAADILSGKKRL